MWRNIAQSKGRFIAIILIILLGTLIFVGVKATGPALNTALDQTVKKAKLSDVQLLSTTGFTKEDSQVAESVTGATAETAKFKYALTAKSKTVVALYGYDATQQQNQLILRSGHLPKHANEIVLDQQAKQKYHYRLGQTFKFAKDAALKQNRYKIVGFADSPQYIDNESRGSANIGDGTVRFFAYLPEKQLNLPTATLLNIRFSNLQTKNTYSKAYLSAVNRKVKALKKVFKVRQKQRTTALQNTVTQQFTPQQMQLTAAKAQLTANQQTNSTAYQTLLAQETQLNAAKKQALAATKTHYTWQTRSELPGFEAYGESSDRIAAIANVFPVFFFLIAALITFTTITRMVEENRSQIGTFKALGYGKGAIAKNYLVYAGLAGIIGTILGSIIGNEALPRIVLALYKAYIPLSHNITLQWGIISIAAVFALLATVGAALIVVNKELTAGPAALMRPRSPKSAKRILLERITPLWRRLSFNRKVSYRNLFRFKSRLFMTIIGIAGGTALILTGFGIQNSIAASGTRQYHEIFNYQAVVRLKNTQSDTKAINILKQAETYQHQTQLATAIGKIQANGKHISDVNLYMPKDTKQFQKYTRLQDVKTGQALKLKNNGVLLTQKAATILGIQVGDPLKLTLTNGQKATVKITGITTNFTGHFIYLNQVTYQKLFQKKPVNNTLLVQLKSQTSQQRDQLAQELLDSGAAIGTSYTHTQQATMTKMAATLDPIVAIFILLSGILSFVVLYNLTNINVSERIRELSTIKVLGFYDREVTLYIVRENIVLTLVGILVGYGIGNLLTAYILHQAATNLIIFPLTIAPIGYITATVLMLVFTAIVMYVTHKKLQHIDMIEALKSNE